mgnify:CR=1 FL=1
MTPEEVDNFRKKVEKETMDKFIEKITVNDSFFYAEMLIYVNADVSDPFNQKLGIVIKMNLHNSKEFQMPMMENTPRKMLKGKEIISKFQIDKERLSSKEDAMMVIYDEVAKQIAQDLFQMNAANIYHTIQGTRRNYI